MLAEALASIKRLGCRQVQHREACRDRDRVHPLPDRSVQADDVRGIFQTLAVDHSKDGRRLLGYWMPHEGTNNIAFALISFESLAAYESYRASLRQDSEGMANFNFAEEHQFILAEERTFLRKVVA
jgi:hypothetical protein